MCNDFSSLRLALAKGCELECPLQLASIAYTVEGKSIRFAINHSYKKAIIAIAEEQLCDISVIRMWQKENDGELPCGIMKCIIPYSAINRMGIVDVADWCRKQLNQVALRYQKPPSDISGVPIITESLPVSEGDDTSTINSSMFARLDAEIAALLRDGEFPCAIVSLMARNPNGVVVDTYSLTFTPKQGWNPSDVASDLVETMKPLYFNDNGLQPGGAVVCGILNDVPREDVLTFVGESLVNLLPKIVPEAQTYTVIKGFMADRS